MTRIELVRSGGFAGMSLRSAVDTSSPDDPDAAWFAQALEDLDPGALDGLAASPPGAGGPDRFRYDLAVDRDGRRHEVSFAETELPEALRPVVDRLVERARTRPDDSRPSR
ncbi:MAG: hypothetical protein QOE19_3185 [Actinomycetota bacterium]|nr:hypothetical protein [Actinomycetota bacterium]